MVSKEVIVKSLEYSINKCKNSSSTARRKGNNVIVSTENIGDDTVITTYSYPNGMSVSFKEETHDVDYGGYDITEVYTDITGLTDNGAEYPMLNDDAYDFFEYQKQYILDNYGEEGWEFFSEYVNRWGSSDGMFLNGLLRGITTEEDVVKETNEELDSFYKEDHDRFVEMEKNLPLDSEGFVSVRVVQNLHPNDSISKKVVSDVGHTCTSVNSDDDYYGMFANTRNCWWVFTVNEKGSGVTGAFIGEGIREVDGDDFEREVNYAPNQEFERVVIDEANHIIIQKPLPSK